MTIARKYISVCACGQFQNRSRVLPPPPARQLASQKSCDHRNLSIYSELAVSDVFHDATTPMKNLASNCSIG